MCKGHGWDLCHLQRAAAKQKGAWEDNGFVLHAVIRNTDNHQAQAGISKGKICLDKGVFIKSCRMQYSPLKWIMKGWRKTYHSKTVFWCAFKMPFCYKRATVVPFCFSPRTATRHCVSQSLCKGLPPPRSPIAAWSTSLQPADWQLQVRRMELRQGYQVGKLCGQQGGANKLTRWQSRNL